MGNFHLSDRQKNMLSILAFYLKDGTVLSEWTLLESGLKPYEHRIWIKDFGKVPDDLHQTWEAFSLQDLNDFQECSLLTHWSLNSTNRRVRIYKNAIINFVENNFSHPPQEPIIIGASQMNNDCYLTEQQKQMLAAIAEGLEQGYTKTDWNVVYGDGHIMVIWGLNEADPTNDKLAELWEAVTDDDLNDYIECGFIVEPVKTFGKANRSLRLNKGRIINFVKNGFSNTNSQNQPSIGQITITGSQNVNVANINSIIHQTLQNTNALQEDERSQLEMMLQKLHDALEALPPEEDESKEEIQTETKALVDAIEKERSKEVVERKANALMKAAEVVKKVSTEVLLAATNISMFVLKLKYLSA